MYYIRNGFLNMILSKNLWKWTVVKKRKGMKVQDSIIDRKGIFCTTSKVQLGPNHPSILRALCGVGQLLHCKTDCISCLHNYPLSLHAFTAPHMTNFTFRQNKMQEFDFSLHDLKLSSQKNSTFHNLHRHKQWPTTFLHECWKPWEFKTA